MINYKTTHEIEMMERAGRALEGVVEALKEAIRPGIRTIDLDRLADKRIRAAGARPGFLGYNGFPNSICVSVNDEAVHGIPGRRRLADGDIVSLDLGLVMDGFWADMGCTVGVGRVDPEAERLMRVTEECLGVAIEPMINQGGPDVYIKPDGWTVCTTDGMLSAYFEHTVAITKDGPRVLTRSNGAHPKQVAV